METARIERTLKTSTLCDGTRVSIVPNKQVIQLNKDTTVTIYPRGFFHFDIYLEINHWSYKDCPKCLGNHSPGDIENCDDTCPCCNCNTCKSKGTVKNRLETLCLNDHDANILQRRLEKPLVIERSLTSEGRIRT
jgi:hypothetical protein